MIVPTVVVGWHCKTSRQNTKYFAVSPFQTYTVIMKFVYCVKQLYIISQCTNLLNNSYKVVHS